MVSAVILLVVEKSKINEVAEQLVRSRLSHTRLVALTGYGGRDARNRALSAGFDDHLVKPFTRDQLEQVFRSLG